MYHSLFNIHKGSFNTKNYYYHYIIIIALLRFIIVDFIFTKVYFKHKIFQVFSNTNTLKLKYFQCTYFGNNVFPVLLYIHMMM